MVLTQYVEDIPFIVTHQVKEMASVCQAVMQGREMGVIYGDPGVGKTVTAEHITKRWAKRGYPRTIYVEADVGSTPAGIAGKILRVFANLRPANAADACRIFGNLAKERDLELVILDEAERLNRHCLEMVRSIFDRTRISVLLIGMSDILAQLRSHKKLYSRVAIAYRYKPLSFEQLADYLAELHPLLEGIDPELEKSLLEFIYTATHGEFRRINQLVKQAERIRKVNEHPVLSLSVFEAASKLLLKAS